MEEKMISNKMKAIFALLIAASLLFSGCAKASEPEEVAEPVAAEESEPFVFGILMVGAYNDQGWSQAHYEAGLYIQEMLPNTEMVYIEKVNTADRPGTTPAQLAEELVARGAKVIIFNSDDMKDGAHEFTAAHPEVIVIHASGDGAWEEGNAYQGFANLSNVMPRMEYGKEIAGCAAALSSDSGNIGYLGPLINEETRRLAASAYLGAKYCWTEVAGKDVADLNFEVKWIGFWFNIPGFTSDPTQVADDFFNRGFDVVISGIDTTEALTEAKKFTDEGSTVYAIPYDFKGACDQAPDVCLGVPYYNWGPSYVNYIQSVIDGTYAPTWDYVGPDWADLNNPDTTSLGFVKGAALSEENGTKLDEFIAALAGGLNLWTGPLNLQDGTPFLADGEVATDYQVWYLPQLLEGMVGLSATAAE
jgi:simple sugar transport system substrate-binding protein